MKRFYPSITLIIGLFLASISYGNNLNNNDCIEFTFIPSDEIIDCDENPNFTLPMAVDNCCPVAVTITKKDTTYTNNCVVVYQRTWTASSICGNSASVVQTITQTDLTPPTFILNDPQLVGLSSGSTITKNCDETFSLQQNPISVVDNCDPNPTITMFDLAEDGNCPNDGYLELLTCYWYTSDNCGNKDTFTLFIQFVDEEEPFISCPDDISLECDADSSPAGTGQATATDNCDENIYIDYWDNIIMVNGCESIIERRWTATDDCWNKINCTQRITLIDSTSPEISCPADATLECDANAYPSVTGFVSATDNCDPDLDVIWSDDTTYITANCEYIIKRTWTVSDECGNASNCMQTLKFEDTTNPDLSCPDDLTLECDEDADTSITGIATATDNCDNNVIIASSDATTYITAECEYLIERTWTATDDCGNVSTCVQNIKFEDTRNPIITCPNDLTLECDANADPSNTGFATASDNCDTDVDITWSDNTIFITAQCEYIIVRTWTATDDCGNVSTCVQNIKFEDTTNPIITCPNDLTLECDANADPDNTGFATASDNCDLDVIITWSDDTTNITSQCEYLIERTWIAMDDCGNISSCVQVIKFEDTINPTISCPSDLTLECDDNADSSNTGFASATDNCDNNVNIIFSDELIFITAQCEYLIERTWTATDDCGNTSSCVQTLKFEDTTNPEITCPSDQTLECDANADPVNTGFASATDNCDANVNIVWSDDTTYVTAQCEYLIERTWTATDDCGNTSSCVQTLKFEDTTNPEITCPSDQTLECDANADPVNTGFASATDNCDANVNIVWSDDTTYVTAQCEYLIERTWTATDDCGNTSSCVQTLKFEDTTNPEITCPADMTLECDANADPSNTGFASATDNCDMAVNIVWSDDTTYVTAQCEYLIERTWTATDDCGNTSSCVQTLNFEDTTNPEITCPSDQTLECDANADPLNTGFASATDNCDANVNIVWSDDTTYVTAQCEYLIERTWTATDDCGNTSSCVQTLKFEDTMNPEITCPNDQTLECDANADPTNTGFASATDNCDANVNIVWSDDTTYVTAQCEYVIERTWTATDDCGNTSSCVQTLNFEDTTNPEITCPADMTLECDANADPINTGFASATDNCDANVNIVWSDDTTYVTAQCEYLIERTWMATDDCGNTSSCVQTLNFEDTTNPEITCPNDQTLECDANADPVNTGFASATDNCDVDVNIVWSDDTTYVTAQCEYLIERTWTATDDCGNTSSCVQTLNFEDTTNPEITCPSDQTLECDANADPVNTGFASATDNCDVDVNIVWSDDTTYVTAQCEYLIERTWTATDDCGNTSSCVQTLKFEDTTNPEITCPSDQTLECDANADPVNTGFASATDNCDVDVNIVWSDDTTYVTAQCEYLIERTWTATDDCGNTSSCVQTLNFEDTTNPEITCPNDQTLECDANADPVNTGFASATDNCDANVNIVWSDDTTYVTAQCEYIIERTWTATDDCGNTSSCVQTLNFEDTTNPEITCPADMTLECDANADPTNTGFASATDNCDVAVNIVWSDDTTYITAQCEYIIERTWTATDDCGNTSSCVQTLNFEDTTNPEITCPADMTLECDANADPVNTGFASATDNCDANVNIVWSDDTTYITAQCEYIIERTWTATDDCGNTSSCVQTLNFEDTTNPEITCPSDQTLECDSNADPVNTGFASATDNCDANVNIVWSDDTTYITAQCEYVIERTWTATDDCGNTSSCVQTLNFEDTTNPEITCPNDQTLECDANADPVNTGFASATDNCDANVNIVWSDDTTYVTAQCEYLIERTWTATDDCGNTSSCVQTLKFEDTTNPEITCPADMTLECDANADPTNTGFASATDNCDVAVNIVWSDDTTYITAQCEYLIERTWTATDDCGNTSSCVQTLNFEDTTNPVIICPNELTLECDANADPINTGFASATDNCDANVNIVWSDDTTYVTAQCEYIIERIWTATDDCGNTSNCVQTLNFEDTTNPEITCPNDQTLECDANADPTNTGFASATDNCDANVNIVWSDDTIYITAQCEYLIERTWTATDDCGNTSSCVQTLKFEDTTNPEITCPNDQTLECDANADPTNTGFASATDNCDANVNIVWSDDTTYITAQCEYVIERIWTATDDCGNTSSCIQTLNFEDTTNPEITCPSDQTLECDANADPVNTGFASATDNCDVDVNIVWSDDTTYITAQCEYLIERTWTATDDCGNTSSCVQTLNFEDTTNPVITCPNDQTLECDANADPSNTGFASATDNCDANVNIVWSDDTTYVTAQCEYLIERTWTATDDCGNTSSCVQTLKFEDTTKPNIFCPNDMTLACNENGDPVNTGFASATDNCDSDVTIVWADDTTFITAQCNYLIERTWTATDDCGNSSSCVQNLKFEDTTKPNIFCPNDVTLECDANGDPSEAGFATATDNCDDIVDIVWSDDTTYITAQCEYLIKRTWTATDDCGNGSACVQNIKSEDTTGPDISCPADVTLECNENGDPSVTGTATATDNCALNIVIDWADDTIYTDQCVYLIERTWSATDDCGNISTCIQNIEYEDTVKPTITCPPNAALECDENADPSVTGFATATDTCDDDLLIEWADDTTFINATCEYLIERVWTATDDCGNSISCIQVMKFEDTTSPVLTCPADITIDCDADNSPAGTGQATATDNCSNHLTITYENNVLTSNSCEAVIERIWTANDNCGNVTTCSQIITIQDLTRPKVFPLAADLVGLNNCDTVEVECDLLPIINIDAFGASDNCDNNVTITFEESVEQFDCADGYKAIMECRWIGTDECSNADTFKLIFRVIDTTPPALVGRHAMTEGATDGDEIMVACQDFEFLDADAFSAIDNCDGDPEITFEELSVSTSDCDLTGGLKVSMVCRWIATDVCGNQNSTTITFVVVDEEGPTFMGIPADITLECADIPDVPSVMAWDNCSAGTSLDFDEFVLTNDDLSCTVTRMWTATDDCGNVSVAEQKITVLDCQDCFDPGVFGFIDFSSGLNQNEQTAVQWTFTGVPKDHIFIVERSFDGNQFTSIGAVEGDLNFASDGYNDYEFIDKNPKIGYNFYRVRAIIGADQPIYSEIDEVQLVDIGTSTFRVYPNPTTDLVFIDFADILPESVNLQLSNELGQLMQEVNMEAGSVRKTIDLSELPEGVYFLLINQPNRKPVAKRIVKLD